MARKHNHAVRRGDGSIEERLTQSGEPRFLARWHNGEKVVSKTFRTLDAAEAHLQDIGQRKRTGRYVPDEDWTVAEVVQDYIDHGRDRWKSNTVATYTTILNNVIAPTIGREKVVDLTARQCQHWINSLRRDYSPARIELIRAVITGALKEAVRLDVIRANPMADVRMPKKSRPERQLWTPEEAKRVLAASEPDPQLHAFYRVALTTGMRPGEIRALMWGDIDLDAGKITVRRSVTRAENYRPIVGDSTKTGKTRTVGIPPRTVAALKRYRASQAERRLRTEHWAKTDLVFDRGDGHVMAQQTFARRHERIIELAGVPHVSPHGMRHVAATLLLEAGVDVKVVSDTLGHSTTTTTRDIYQHVTERLQRTAADTLGALLDDVHEA